jgi:hypothetical protein
MKRTFYLILLLIVYSLNSFAQENCNNENKADSGKVYKFCFRYGVDEESLYSIDDEDLTEHPLGDDIARKLYLLRETYTYIEHPTPTSPGEKTIITKPSIYNSLQKLNRYYKKQVKAGEMTEEEARIKLGQYLDVAISIFIENTESFEDELRKAKKPDEISEVFSMVMLKQ